MKTTGINVNNNMDLKLIPNISVLNLKNSRIFSTTTSQIKPYTSRQLSLINILFSPNSNK